MAEEGVAEALALVGALHQPGDVHYVQEGGNLGEGEEEVQERCRGCRGGGGEGGEGGAGGAGGSGGKCSGGAQEE